MERTLRFALVLAALGTVGAAAAQVRDYALFRTNSYLQTSATTATYDGSFVGAKINVTAPDDYAGASVAGNAMDLDATDPSAPLYTYGSNVYPSQAALEVDFPYPAAFDFQVAANNQPDGSAILADDLARFSPDVPTIPEYAALQGIQPGTDVGLSVAGFRPGTGTNLNQTYYQVRNLSTSGLIADGVNTNAPFTIDLRGSDLLPGNDYLVTIVYSSRLTGIGNGFGGAPSILSYDNRTDFTFSVSPVPEPSAWAALGLGALVVRRRTRRG